jgi:hypothetical protein
MGFDPPSREGDADVVRLVGLDHGGRLFHLKNFKLRAIPFIA